MRRTLIVTLTVLAIALASCTASLLILDGAVRHADRLRSAAVLASQERRTGRARELMVELAEFWREKSRLLEILADHDALHEVQAAIAEAQICLECDDHDDFLRTMSTVAEDLNHIRDEQSPRLSNLY